MGMMTRFCGLRRLSPDLSWGGRLGRGCGWCLLYVLRPQRQGRWSASPLPWWTARQATRCPPCPCRPGCAGDRGDQHDRRRRPGDPRSLLALLGGFLGRRHRGWNTHWTVLPSSSGAPVDAPTTLFRLDLDPRYRCRKGRPKDPTPSGQTAPRSPNRGDCQLARGLPLVARLAQPKRGEFSRRSICMARLLISHPVRDGMLNAVLHQVPDAPIRVQFRVGAVDAPAVLVHNPHVQAARLCSLRSW